jgi:hypothetical protein
MKRWTFVLVGVLIAVVAFSTCGAENSLIGSAVRNDQQLGIKHLNSLGLLDPNRLSMSQSYSLMFLSDGKKSQASGFYLNRLIYQFSAPISLKLEMGYLHSSLPGWGKSTTTDGEFFPALEVLYRPSRNFSLSFQYRVLPSLYNSCGYPYCQRFNR